MNFNDYDQWVAFMRNSIAAQSIAIQAWEQLHSGAGAPDEDDMRRFHEEGFAVADLWKESLTSREMNP